MTFSNDSVKILAQILSQSDTELTQSLIKNVEMQMVFLYYLSKDETEIDRWSTMVALFAIAYKTGYNVAQAQKLEEMVGIG